MGEENLFNISSGFLRRIGYIKQRQEDELNKILPDITFLRKITGILIDNEKADVLIDKIYKIPPAFFYIIPLFGKHENDNSLADTQKILLRQSR